MAKKEPTPGRGKRPSSVEDPLCSTVAYVGRRVRSLQAQQRYDCAGNKQRQASLAKCSGHRDVRTVRRSGQSRDEFADTLSVLFNARSNDANSNPRIQQPGWRLARLPLHGLAQRSSDSGVRQVGVAQGSARDSTAK
jgi:hypothetical protein